MASASQKEDSNIISAQPMVKEQTKKIRKARRLRFICSSFVIEKLPQSDLSVVSWQSLYETMAVSVTSA
ncbi:MAG: hypothetical protein AAB575_02210 [Patescibacteria group bacterium]